MTGIKEIEKFIKKRDEVLKKPLEAETNRMNADKEVVKIDVFENKDECGLIIGDSRYSLHKNVFELFLDMLSGNRMLTKKVEVLKLIINKHKIMAVPEGVNIIKPIGVGNATKT